MQTDRKALWSSTYSHEHIWIASMTEWWRWRSWWAENICQVLSLSLRLHAFLPPSPDDLWYLFLGALASLTWSGIGCSSFWKTPTGLPSVCGSGRMGIPDIWSHQFKATVLRCFCCALEIQIAHFGLLERSSFQWQTNNRNQWHWSLHIKLWLTKHCWSNLCMMNILYTNVTATTMNVWCNWYKEWKELFAWYLFRTVGEREKETGLNFPHRERAVNETHCVT